MGTFNEIYKRILFVANCQTQIDLAGILEISQSSISDAKRRQSVPSDWLIKLYDKFGVNPDWLREKKEPMYLRGIATIDEENSHFVLEDVSRGFMAKVYDTFCEKHRTAILLKPLMKSFCRKTCKNARATFSIITETAWTQAYPALRSSEFPPKRTKRQCLSFPENFMRFTYRRKA